MKVRDVHPTGVAGKENRKASSSAAKYETSTVDDGDHTWRVRVGKRWSVDSFQWGHKLGKGRFGSVYAAKEKESGFICALKVNLLSLAPVHRFNNGCQMTIRVQVMYRSQLKKSSMEYQVRREIEIQVRVPYT